MPAQQQQVTAHRAAAVDQQKAKQYAGPRPQPEVGPSGSQKPTKDGCSNPFRIPNHNVHTALRNVPTVIRERLAHVNFGRRICTNCRIRVYKMLKERKVLKPSSRLSNGAQGSGVAAGSRKPQPQQRRSELLATGVPSRLAGATSPLDQAAANSRVADGERLKEPAVERPPVPTTARDVVEQMAAIAPDHSSSNLVDNLNRLSETTMARRTKSQLALPPDLCPSKQVCCFCNMNDDNEVEFGKFYHHNGIVTHYYCLLLSSNMEQKGSDDQGILGFLAEDIQKEIKRGKRLVCSYCKKNGATLGCCNTKCKRIFHLPCGLKAGSLHQFFGEFRSYCISHRPRQKIDDRVKKEIEKMSNILCYICYEEVKPLDSNGTLWAPCCKKNAWFHRSCVQQLAMSAGYFFKCPLCNNKREFQTAMLEYGIYIPRQDASWELVPNAFEELLYRHDRCDSKICQCPKGRTYTSSNGKWELILCRTCGSQGVHVLCGQLKWSKPTWDCPECIIILKKNIENASEDSSSNLTESTRDEGHALNLTAMGDDDSDSDISVGNESLPLDSTLSSIPANELKLIEHEVKLRPGPKSFKLQQVKKMKMNIDSVSSSNSNEASNSSYMASTESAKPKSSEDVICLDSDDDAPQIVCESTMRSTSKLGRHIAAFSNFKGAGSSNVFNFANAGFITNLQLSSISLGAPQTLTIPLKTQIEDQSPFNIIISNVTSVPEEFFANVPEESNDIPQARTSAAKTSSAATLLPEKQKLPLKRPREDDSVKTTKRVRLDIDETTINHQTKTKEIASNSTEVSKTVKVDTVNNSLPNIELASSNQVNATTSEGGSNGMSHENCHGNAGDKSAALDSGRVNSSTTATIQFTTESDKPELSAGIATVNHQASTTAKQLLEPLCTVFKNGPNTIGNSSRSSSGSSKSRNPSCNRAGLIPDIVRLSDLKFRIFGDDVEISLGDFKIQVKSNGVPQNTDSKTGDISSDSDRTALSLSESRNVSSSKSDSKPNSLHFDDSATETVHSLRQLKSGCSKNFVYEDDNTLLEYPTTTTDTLRNARLVRKSGKHDRNDLKENWDPEVSSSSRNNILDSFNNNNSNNNNNHNQTSSSELKSMFHSFEKSNNKFDDNSGVVIKKENPDTNQRLLRRSNRTVRHFRSIKSSNGLINSDSMDSNTMNLLSQSVEKTNQPNNLAVRNTRSQKILDNCKVPEQDKHLKNVDINDLRFDLTGKVNVKRENNEIDADKDFKVSIDLQKIKNFIRAKPDLFLKTEHGVNRNMNVYSMDVKLKVELCSGEKIFLTKAQSFDCLLDIAKNDDLQLSRSSCKSLSELSQITSTNNNNLNLTDKRDCTAKKIRRSQRRKSKRCVR